MKVGESWGKVGKSWEILKISWKIWNSYAISSHQRRSREDPIRNWAVGYWVGKSWRKVGKSWESKNIGKSPEVWDKNTHKILQNQWKHLKFLLWPRVTSCCHYRYRIQFHKCRYGVSPTISNEIRYFFGTFVSLYNYKGKWDFAFYVGTLRSWKRYLEAKLVLKKHHLIN